MTHSAENREPDRAEPEAGSHGRSADERASSAGPGSAAGASRARLPASTIAWGVALGGAVGIAATLAAFAYVARGTAEILTLEALRAAQAQWEQAGPASYNQELELVGSQAGTILVEVRHGEVTRMVRNGYQPSQQRTWRYWSVPGQFETIEVDWEAAQDPPRGFGVAPGTRAILRAEFDPQYGYPRYYQRILLGTGIHVEWRVTRFEAVPD